MLDELKDRIAGCLSKQQMGIISACSAGSGSSIPVWYRSQGILIDCLLPRWSDVLYLLEKDPRATIIIADTSAGSLRWIQYQGLAKPVLSPDWDPDFPAESLVAGTDDRYQLLRIHPSRIDLLDESKGWGVRETLDI